MSGDGAQIALLEELGPILVLQSKYFEACHKSYEPHKRQIDPRFLPTTKKVRPGLTRP